MHEKHVRLNAKMKFMIIPPLIESRTLAQATLILQPQGGAEAVLGFPSNDKE